MALCCVAGLPAAVVAVVADKFGEAACCLLRSVAEGEGCRANSVGYGLNKNFSGFWSRSVMLFLIHNRYILHFPLNALMLVDATQGKEWNASEE